MDKAIFQKDENEEEENSKKKEEEKKGMEFEDENQTEKPKFTYSNLTRYLKNTFQNAKGF